MKDVDMKNAFYATCLICLHVIYLRRCSGQKVKTSESFLTRGPGLYPRPSSTTLVQGTLSSLLSLSDETLSHLSLVQKGNTQQPTQLFAKNMEKSQCSGQTLQTGSYTVVARPTGHRHPPVEDYNT